ncbi:MAG: DMT family transporter [Treponema sp.]|nr:DMT family transporter [Treponema sp.]
MSKRQKAIASIIICVLFWGLSFISIKITVAVFPPMSLGMLRFAIAIVFLFFIKLKLAPDEKLTPKDIPMILAAGLFGVTLYFFFENNGVLLVSASEASIAIGCIPILAMIADWLTEKLADLKKGRTSDKETKKHHKIGARQWLGALISIAGVWLVAGVSLALSGSILGYIYMFGAALSWVTYSLLTRTLSGRRSRIFIVFWQSVAGFIGFIPFSMLELKQWGAVNTPIIFHLLFLGICCSALGYLFYVQAIDGLGVSVCAIFINIIPVITVIFGFIMLGDRLTLLQWLGAVLVISGVYLSIWEKKRL